MPIERLNLNWLRTHIRLVQQEPVLFNGTVFDNIAYGLVEDSPGSSSIAEKKTLVKQAAKLAFAHNFITMLPNGYATRIGERGSLLSGGQKQRIAIARSIISKPRILLLDEVTSALDPHAETIVQKTLDNISRSLGVTVVVIAHKISTVRHADNIFVMSKGRVVENGTDESLIALNGIYARMVQVQNLAVDTKRCSGSQITTNNQSSDEKTANGGDLSLRETKAAYNNRATTADDYSFANIKQIGLLSAVWKLLRENSELNRYFLMILVGCIFGSRSSPRFECPVCTYGIIGGVLPGQALLMAHVMDIFGLDPDQMKERGSFYSLMFFILGLGALVNYFILGWISNIAAQDMNKRFRSNLLDHVLRQDIPFFDLPENMVGALTSRVDLAAQVFSFWLFPPNSPALLVILVKVIESNPKLAGYHRTYEYKHHSGLGYRNDCASLQHTINSHPLETWSGRCIRRAVSVTNSRLYTNPPANAIGPGKRITLCRKRCYCFRIDSSYSNSIKPCYRELSTATIHRYA